MKWRAPREVGRNSAIAGVSAFLLMAGLIILGTHEEGLGRYWMETVVFSSAAGLAAWLSVRVAAFLTAWLERRRGR